MSYQRVLTLLQQHQQQAHPACVFQGQSVSYAALWQSSHAIATVLQQHGLQRGDRVVIAHSHPREVVYFFWACLHLDLCVSIVDVRQPLARLRQILINNQPALLVTEPEQLPSLCDVATASVPLQRVITSGCDALNAPDFVRYVSSKDAGPTPAPLVQDETTDVCLMMYTSGSTGQSKGVMMTHANVLAAVTSIASYLELTAADRILNILPLSFDYGLYQLLLAAQVGATVVLAPGEWLPNRVFKMLETQACTVLPLVSTLATMLYQCRRMCSAPLEQVKTVTNTGMVLSFNHIQLLQALFPRARIFSMYGLTECKRVSYIPPEQLQAKHLSIGIPIPGTQVSIVHADGTLCAPGQLGQIVVQSETVMQGYWNNPLETQAKIRAHPITGQRALWTGDMGWMDAEGFLYFGGRQDDLVKIKGQKVYTNVVERCVHLYPGVINCCVIAANVGDEMALTCYVQAAAELDLEGVRQHCLLQLNAYEVPQRFVVVEQFVLNANNKIDKRRLKEGLCHDAHSTD